MSFFRLFSAFLLHTLPITHELCDHLQNGVVNLNTHTHTVYITQFFIVIVDEKCIPKLINGMTMAATKKQQQNQKILNEKLERQYATYFVRLNTHTRISDFHFKLPQTRSECVTPIFVYVLPLLCSLCMAESTTKAISKSKK